MTAATEPAAEEKIRLLSVGLRALADSRPEVFAVLADAFSAAVIAAIESGGEQ